MGPMLPRSLGGRSVPPLLLLPGETRGMGLVPTFPRVAGCLDIDVWGSSDARSVTFLSCLLAIGVVSSMFAPEKHKRPFCERVAAYKKIPFVVACYFLGGL